MYVYELVCVMLFVCVVMQQEFPTESSEEGVEEMDSINVS